MGSVMFFFFPGDLQICMFLANLTTDLYVSCIILLLLIVFEFYYFTFIQIPVKFTSIVVSVCFRWIKTEKKKIGEMLFYYHINAV